MADGQGRLPQARQDLLTIYQAALAAVHGREAVSRDLRQHPLGRTPCRLVAIGKAAAAMTQGALDVLGDGIVEGLVITKYGHGDTALAERFTCLEAGHPVPDQASLEAGRALIEFITASPDDSDVLFLISGGSSALVEVLPQGMTLDDLAEVNQWLLGSGLAIAGMNRVRRALSCIKGGRLGGYLKGRTARQLLISDVPGDDPAVIGSGLLVPSRPLALPDDLPGWLRAYLQTDTEPTQDAAPPVETRIVACLADAKQAAAHRAATLAYATYIHDEFLAGDAEQVARTRVHELQDAAAGVHIWGGETTVTLPRRPGRGGRNQHLALVAALEMERRGLHDAVLLAVGTDGSDGPTEDAGALVDGDTCARGRLSGLDPGDHLARADAGTFLQESGDLVQTGPTGTNVMDLVLALKLGG